MNALLAIAYALVPGFPAGSVVANIVATITGSASGNTTPQSQTVAPGTASVTFAGVAADTYTYSVGAVDANNNTLGTAVTGSFTITAPSTISLNLPASVTVTQG